jgi:membrane protease YdiL (CAAX protease family)
MLPAWQAPPSEIFLFLLHVFGGAFIGSLLVGLLHRPLRLDGDRLVIVATLVAHVCMLAGVALFSMTPRGRFIASVDSPFGVIKSGVVTFLIAMPITLATGLLWTGLLKLCGLSVERQLAVELFVRLKSVPWLVLMATTAAFIAPMSEEFLFRAGIFRYLRTRLPRWAALLLPASLFAAMHTDLGSYAQLAVLGLLFSLAYERTGKIGTAIVAHACFNLNMLVMLLAGLPT